MSQFTVETAFADAAAKNGVPSFRNVRIKGPGRFLATFRDKPENRAHARLLVAAPDLLEALRYIAKQWPDSFAARTARAAIAKSEGQS